MVCFFNSNHLNRLFLYGLLTTFPLAVLTPPPAYAQIDFNKVAFAVKMEKLVEKLWKYKERGDSEKLLETMLDVKLEVEGYSGVKINLDAELDKTERELKKQKTKIPKKDFQLVRSFIKNKEKKANHRAMCMESYMLETPGISYAEYEFLYRAANEEGKDQEQEKQELPMRLAIGITMMLAGGFLCILGIEFPICMEYGKQVAAAGVTFAIEGYVNRQDEDKDKDNNKNK